MKYILQLVIISICYFGYVKISNVPIPAIVLSFAVFYSFLKLLLQKTIKVNKILFFLTLVIIIFFIVDCFVNEKIVYRYLERNAYYFLFCLILFRIDRELSFKLANFYLIIICISLFIGSLQALNIEMFWLLREPFGYGGDETVKFQIENRLKAPGLAFYAVQLSYQTTAALLAAIYLYINGVYSKKQFQVCSLFLLFASSLIGITSSVVCIAVVLFANYLVVQKSKYKIRTLFWICLLTLILLVFTNAGSRIMNPDSSMLSRLVFAYIGLLVLFKHPFGVSLIDIYDAKQAALEQMGPSNLIGFADYILKTSFHNTFINIGVDLGLIGMSLAMLCFLIIPRASLRQIGTERKEHATLYRLFFLGYLVQITTHNASIFYGDLYLAFILVLILSSTGVSSKRMFKVAHKTD